MMRRDARALGIQPKQLFSGQTETDPSSAHCDVCSARYAWSSAAISIVGPHLSLSYLASIDGWAPACADDVLELLYITAQGVIADANMILVDFHPAPAKALVDGPQALTLEELPMYLEDIAIAREAYEKRRGLEQRILRSYA